MRIRKEARMYLTVKYGDIVRVHYTARYEGGEIFDSTLEGEPIQFEVGSGEVIDGLDEALLNMRPGDQKTIIVPPEMGFGEQDDELFIEIERDQLPSTIRPEIGMRVQIVDGEGETTPVVVSELSDDSIVVDANHPLAGKFIEYDIELIEILES